jgi:hypothetical protein
VFSFVERGETQIKGIGSTRTHFLQAARAYTKSH